MLCFERTSGRETRVPATDRLAVKHVVATTRPCIKGTCVALHTSHVGPLGHLGAVFKPANQEIKMLSLSKPIKVG